MTQDSNSTESFWQRSNDLRRRQWRYRLARFVRAGVRTWCQRLIRLADEPRTVQAWRRGWDVDHYVRLRRWHDGGFRPHVVYDIGAHAGVWSEMCQSILNPREIFLFEPQADLQAQAQARGRKLGGQWQVLPFALGAREETQVMYVTENGAASSMLQPISDHVPAEWGTTAVGQEKVQVTTLDGVVARRGMPKPDLVKIDVQGFEGEVLAGGSAVLRNSQRMIVEVSLRELYRGQALLPEVLETVTGWGFELEDVTETCREWAGRLWQVDLFFAARDKREFTAENRITSG